MGAVVMKYWNNIKNTNFDVYVFTTNTDSIPLLVDYYHHSCSQCFRQR